MVSLLGSLCFGVLLRGVCFGCDFVCKIVVGYNGAFCLRISWCTFVYYIVCAFRGLVCVYLCSCILD